MSGVGPLRGFPWCPLATRSWRLCYFFPFACSHRSLPAATPQGLMISFIVLYRLCSCITFWHGAPRRTCDENIETQVRADGTKIQKTTYRNCFILFSGPVRSARETCPGSACAFGSDSPAHHTVRSPTRRVVFQRNQPKHAILPCCKQLRGCCGWGFPSALITSQPSAIMYNS